MIETKFISLLLKGLSGRMRSQRGRNIKRNSIIVITCIALATLIIVGISLRSRFTGVETETLPVLHIGDKWTFTVKHGQETYTLIRVITGEEKKDGKDCYVGHESIVSHFIARVENVKVWIDKATLHLIKAESRVWFSGDSGITTTTYSCEWTEQPFPLEAGKELGVTVRSTFTSTFPWMENENKVENLTCKIGRIENITVLAGKFEIFRWVTYDNQCDIIGIKWYSNRAKTFVKKINAKENITWELISYSVK